jgi:hypothetical protein
MVTEYEAPKAYRKRNCKLRALLGEGRAVRPVIFSSGPPDKADAG